MFWGITVFRLFPVILVLMVVRFGSAMAVVDEYIIVGSFDQTGRPIRGRSTCMTPRSAADSQFRGYAAAIGWMGALLMLIVVAGMFWLFRSRD